MIVTAPWRRAAALLGLLTGLAVASPARADDVANVILTVVDQDGAPLVGSRINIDGATHGNGDLVELALGTYIVRILPGIDGLAQNPYDYFQANNTLWRTDTVTITAGQTTLDLLWETRKGALRVVDQVGVDVAGSQVRLAGTYARWFENTALPHTVVLPVNTYASASGNWAAANGGYAFDILPGVDGKVQNPYAYYQLNKTLWRTDRIVVDAGDGGLALEWPVFRGPLHVVDQEGTDIAASELRLRGTYLSLITQTTPFDTVLPDNTVPGAMGLWAAANGGYTFEVRPGVAGQVPNASNPWLTRTNVLTVVDAAAISVGHLDLSWQQVDCTMSLLDTSGEPVAGGTVDLPAPFPARLPDEAVMLPITDAVVYPTLAGLWAAGYPITVVPGDGNTANVQVAVLADGTLAPSTVTVAGTEYRLTCTSGALEIDCTGQPNGTVVASGVPCGTGTCGDVTGDVTCQDGVAVSSCDPAYAVIPDTECHATDVAAVAYAIVYDGGGVPRGTIRCVRDLAGAVTCDEEPGQPGRLRVYEGLYCPAATP